MQFILETKGRKKTQESSEESDRDQDRYVKELM